MNDCFAYSFANNDGRHSPSLLGRTQNLKKVYEIPIRDRPLDIYWVDACISSFTMIQAWKESFFQLNIQASILSVSIM